MPTDVFAPTVPSWAVPLLRAALRWLPISTSEESAGWAQAQILASPNMERRRVCYFSHELEGRRALERAYDPRFQAWLWRHLGSLRRDGARELYRHVPAREEGRDAALGEGGGS